MRLIDADTLVKGLSYLYTKNHIPVDMRAKEILTTIMEQPTAYSVDKVVEEIIEEAHNTIVDFKLNKYVYTNKAIEIVKQGGVSDDVCEWISVSDKGFIKNPHTKRLFSNETSMKNVYCNTCGKKDKGGVEE